jgi:phage terminase small subunit
MPELRNKKWEAACQAYVLESCTKTDAYIAGFPHNAKKNRQILGTRSHELFKRQRVIDRVAELSLEKEKVAKEQFQIDAAYVLERLADIDRMDVLDILEDDGSLKPVREWPLIWRQFVSQFEVDEIFAGRGDDKLQVGLLKKIKWPDKIRNLELLGKHVSVSAFKEIQEIHGPGGGPLRLITDNMTPQQAAEAYADTLNDE